MAFSQEAFGVSIVGDNPAQAAGENPVPLSRDGSAPALSIAVPLGEKLVVADWINCATSLTPARLQQSNDGGLNWFDIALMRTGLNDTNKMDLRTPLVVVGGPGVLVRVLANPPAGPAEFITNLRCMSYAA